MLPSDCFVIHTCEYHHETYFQRLALTNRNRPNVTTICQGRNSSIFMPSRTTLSTTISLSILPVLITSLEWPNREYLRCKVARPFAGRIEPLANQHNCFGYWYCGFFVIGVCSPHWNRSCLLPVLFRGDFALLLMVEWSKHSDWYSKRLRLGCRCHALMLTHVLGRNSIETLFLSHGLIDCGGNRFSSKPTIDWMSAVDFARAAGLDFR